MGDSVAHRCESAGAVSRNSAILHGVWVLLAAGLAVAVLERIPLAVLAALVMVVGIRMVKVSHIRTVTRHREVLVYAATFAGVVLLGVLEGVGVGIVLAVAVALNRLSRTRVTSEFDDRAHRVRVRGPLTFLAVPRLSRALCGHSGCGAMQALHDAGSAAADSSLGRWLRHGAAGVRPVAEQPASVPRIPGRVSDELETLCLTNVVQQLDHLVAHPCVAQRVAAGALELHGMYFHVAEAQAYVMGLAPFAGDGQPVFLPVEPENAAAGQEPVAGTGCGAHATAGTAGPAMKRGL